MGSSVSPWLEGQATPDLVAQWRRLLTVALEAGAYTRPLFAST